jgi:hypothetical protein
LISKGIKYYLTSQPPLLKGEEEKFIKYCIVFPLSSEERGARRAG